MRVYIFIESRTVASYVRVFGAGRNEIVISVTDVLTYCKLISVILSVRFLVVIFSVNLSSTGKVRAVT